MCCPTAFQQLSTPITTARRGTCPISLSRPRFWKPPGRLRNQALRSPPAGQAIRLPRVFYWVRSAFLTVFIGNALFNVQPLKLRRCISANEPQPARGRNPPRKVCGSCLQPFVRDEG